MVNLAARQFWLRVTLSAFWICTSNNMKPLIILVFPSILAMKSISKLVCQLLLYSLLLFAETAYAASGTWLNNPVDNNWSTPANWSSQTVPGPFDTATFESSSITDLEITPGAAVADIFFDPNAEAFTITALPSVSFSILDSVVNNSGVEQNFVAESNADDSGSFLLQTDSGAEATISGPVTFTQKARNRDDTGYPGLVQIIFTDAGDAIFHNLGASVAGGIGGWTNFFDARTSAQNCTIINEGATAAGALGGSTQFAVDSPTAANATLIANGGTNGGGGGSFSFFNKSTGRTARVELFGNGYFDISGHESGTFTIGSLEGDGIVYLGRNTLSVGGNGSSTTFAGLLLPGDPNGGAGTGGLTKTSSAILTLSGPNLYTAGTTITDGRLVASNTSGSATGTGAVNVTAGTLGRSGTIAGGVTIGTGSGAGAFLAPAHGGNKQLTLTIQSSLTFNSDATYTYTFKAKGSKSKIDKVIANGVTINSGASFNLSGTTQGTLTQGTSLTVIKNTAATPISGVFSNLPDGGIVTVNGNNFQADYQGGDGNDLTLTVVP
jgi:autotransporter-associated beta strand protein